MFDNTGKGAAEFEFSSLEKLFKGVPPVNQSSKESPQLEKDVGLLLILLGNDERQAELKRTYWALQLSCNNTLSDQATQFSKGNGSLFPLTHSRTEGAWKGILAP